jgi:hypothetical protein
MWWEQPVENLGSQARQLYMLLVQVVELLVPEPLEAP